jgi:hypothetical protein
MEIDIEGQKIDILGNQVFGWRISGIGHQEVRAFPFDQIQ